MQGLVALHNHQYVKISGARAIWFVLLKPIFQGLITHQSEVNFGGETNSTIVLLLNKRAKFKDVSKELRKNLGIL